MADTFKIIASDSITLGYDDIGICFCLLVGFSFTGPIGSVSKNFTSTPFEKKNRKIKFQLIFLPLFYRLHFCTLLVKVDLEKSGKVNGVVNMSQ